MSGVTYFTRTAVLAAPSPHLKAKAVRERPSVQRDLERCASQRRVGGVGVPRLMRRQPRLGPGPAAEGVLNDDEQAKPDEHRGRNHDMLARQADVIDMVVVVVVIGALKSKALLAVRRRICTRGTRTG